MIFIFRIFYEIINYLKESPRDFFHWINIRVLKKHRLYTAFGEVVAGEDIFIFACFPGTTPIESVSRLLEAAENEGYLALVVINKNPLASEWLNLLGKPGRQLLLRENIGADFGAYKLAMQYLKETKQYENAQNLIIANDSLVYSPASISTIRDLLLNNNDFNCLWFNRQNVEHAGSFFLKFNKAILQNHDFVNFWTSYYPFRLKRKIITRGEHQLTRVLPKNYFVPLTSKNSNHKDFLLRPEELLQFSLWLSKSEKNLFLGFQSFLTEGNSQFLINYAEFNLHISNSIGLWLARVKDFPLKMDLCSLGLTTPEYFREVLAKQGCVTSELNLAYKLATNKGSSLTRNIFQRLFS